MISTEDHKGVTVVRLEGTDNITASVTEPIKKELKDLYYKPNTKLAFDLSNVKYIDSSGFGVFLSLKKTSFENKGHFKIFNLNPKTGELFKLLHLDTILEIYKSREECLSSFVD